MRHSVAATASYTVQFGPAPKPEAEPKRRIPRVARLLALAHQIDRKIRAGELKSLADAARKLGLTRARVTQIMNLLLLAPDIQEAIVMLPLVRSGRESFSERTLRPVLSECCWNRQRELWRLRRSQSARH